jgi:hypothetical protein
MHEFIDDKGNRLVLTDAEVMILIEMGFFSYLKNKKIRFNPRPFSNPLHLNEEKVVRPPEDTVVDLHLELVKKVDEIIDRHNRELTEINIETIATSNIPPALGDIVEQRNQNIRRPETSNFGQDFDQMPVFKEVAPGEELFDVEIPQDIPLGSTLTPVQNIQESQEEPEEEFKSEMFVGETEKKTVWGHGKVKDNTKSKPQKQKTQQQPTNGISKAMMDLEETKRKIEAKKKELEVVEEKVKEKQEELKKKQKEKKKEELKRKKEEKRALKEKEKKERELAKLEKIKQKQQLKEQKKRELEQAKLEKLKEKQALKEQKQKQIEEKKLRKQREIEAKKAEKQK